MSRFIFIHDFYRDGYNDMLEEVHDLQAQGLWTKERRKSVAKHELSTYHACKHKFPRMDTSYWAGRLAAIRSVATAHYPICSKTIFILLRDEKPAFCGSCGDTAVWKSAKQSDGLPVLFRCDCCKQELVRAQTYRAPDGWDWNKHEELLPLPVPVGNKLVVKEHLEPEYIFFPCTATIALAMLDLMVHMPVPMLLAQVVFVLHLTVKGKDYWQAFCKWMESEL